MSSIKDFLHKSKIVERFLGEMKSSRAAYSNVRKVLGQVPTTKSPARLALLHKSKIVEGFLEETKPSTAAYIDVREERRQIPTTTSPTRLALLHKSKIVEGFLEETKPSTAAYIDVREERRQIPTTTSPTRLALLHKSKIVEGFLEETKPSTAAYIDVREERRQIPTTTSPTRLALLHKSKIVEGFLEETKPSTAAYIDVREERRQIPTTTSPTRLALLHKSKIVEGFLEETKPSTAAYIDVREERRQIPTTTSPTRLTYAQKFLKATLSFICLVSLFSCQSNKETVVPRSKEVAQETLEVAILMPLTGEHSTLGKQYNQLIKMGLEDGLKTYVHVTSYDGSNEKQVLAAMDKILLRKTKIILGPLYSNLTSIIANKAKAHDIIIITMSNNPVLADKKLFVFGHAPSKQLTKIINYFADNDYKNFIALLPSGSHAQAINQLIQNILIQKNSTLVRSEFYANIPESIEKAVLTVSNSVDNLNEMEDTATKPVIYLSDDGKNLDLLFDSIHKHNLDKKAIIIGDNRIDIDRSEPVDIIYTGSLNIVNSNIIERAKNIGINHLSFMHTVAYDLGRITSKYIGSNFSEERFLAAINGKTPYTGISGNVYFIDSIAQREYDIIKKEDGLYSTMAKSDNKF